ncbi:MAG: hypothetical protein JHC66_04120 [Acidimicrobiia bacterium]|nr:hypothetical protein [Acidimicrobiia bacterium]
MKKLQQSSSAPRLRSRRYTRFILLGFVLLISPVLSASSASAHGLGGPESTNVDVSTSGADPSISGVSIRMLNLGYLIELNNSGPNTVVVIGYDREPYLRISPSGVEVNRRSPATFLNRSATPSGSLPDGLNARATPLWESTSKVPTARWHDHRAHWMGRGAVNNAEWSIPLIVTNRDTSSESEASIAGTLDSVAPPSTLMWGLIAVSIAITLGALGRTRRWAGVLLCALSVITVSEALHIVGAWGAWSAPIPTRLLGLAPSVFAVAFSVIALVILVARRSTRPDSATPFALIAGIFIAIAGGLADLSTLTQALVPTTLSPPIARLTVALAIGGGVGVAIIAGSHLKPVALNPQINDVEPAGSVEG